jgi:predicted porin
MKKTLIALSALLAGAAMAQSSVTVFGIVDLAARNLKGADSVKYLSNEGRSASRLGFRGVEDMGGGLKASFHIEHGFNPDAGTTDAVFWQRRATVSLSGDFGEVRLGRHKTATRTLQDDFDVFGTSGMPGLNRIMGLDRNRIDNQVAYFFPKMGSFYGNVEVSAGEGAQGGTGSGAGRSMAGRFGYREGGLNVSGAYGQYGVGSQKLKITALGGSYAMGDFTLLGQYNQYKLGSSTHKVANLAGAMKIGSGRVLASYGRAGGIRNNKADLLAVGYDHSLSRRTTLYTTFARIDNKEATTYSLLGASGRALPLAGGNSTGYEFGVRHNF